MSQGWEKEQVENKVPKMSKIEATAESTLPQAERPLQSAHSGLSLDEKGISTRTPASDTEATPAPVSPGC